MKSLEKNSTTISIMEPPPQIVLMAVLHRSYQRLSKSILKNSHPEEKFCEKHSLPQHSTSKKSPEKSGKGGERIATVEEKDSTAITKGELLP